MTLTPAASPAPRCSTWPDGRDVCSPALARSAPHIGTASTATAHRHRVNCTASTGEQPRDYLGDGPLLVGRHDTHRDLRATRGDDARTVCRLVCVMVDRDAEPFHPSQGSRAHDRAMFAYPRGEHDGIQPAEHRVIRADIL